jgi:hypothetical protein
MKNASDISGYHRTLPPGSIRSMERAVARHRPAQPGAHLRAVRPAAKPAGTRQERNVMAGVVPAIYATAGAAWMAGLRLIVSHKSALDSD